MLTISIRGFDSSDGSAIVIGSALLCAQALSLFSFMQNGTHKSNSQ